MSICGLELVFSFVPPGRLPFGPKVTLTLKPTLSKSWGVKVMSPAQAEEQDASKAATANLTFAFLSFVSESDFISEIRFRYFCSVALALGIDFKSWRGCFQSKVYVTVAN